MQTKLEVSDLDVYLAVGEPDMRPPPSWGEINQIVRDWCESSDYFDLIVERVRPRHMLAFSNGEVVGPMAETWELSLSRVNALGLQEAWLGNRGNEEAAMLFHFEVTKEIYRVREEIVARTTKT